MASPLFLVRVTDIADRTVKFRLFIIHPDQELFYLSEAFALQILWDPVHPRHKVESALGRAISQDQILDPDYVWDNVERFIEYVGMEDRKNYPRTTDLSTMSEDELRAYWANKDGLPQVTLIVRVTDPKWIAHLEPGMEWKTTAYDM